MLGALARVRRYAATFQDDAKGGWIEKAHIMRDLAQMDAQGLRDLDLFEHWREATRKVPHRNAIGEIRAWFDYLQRHIRYQPANLGYSEVRGPDGERFLAPLTQRLVRPGVAFRLGFGDCTTYSIAGSAGLAIGGYDSNFAYVSTRADRVPSHVYLHVFFPPRTHAKALAFDASVREPLGWEVPASRVTWRASVPAVAPWDGPTRNVAVSGLGALYAY